MKNPVIISCIIILSLFSLSCQIGNEQTKNDEAILINLNKKEATKQIYLSQFLLHSEYISLETSPSCLIGSIHKMEIYKDRIFILDPYTAKKLLVFDKAGKFLYQISERGNGPGEYWDIFDFVIQDNKIYVLNNRTSVIEYTIDGTFIRTYSLPLWADRMLTINNKNWGLLINADKSNGYDSSFYITTLDFDKEKGYLKSKFEDFPIEPLKQVSSLYDTSYFFLPLGNNIYCANKTGVIEKYVLQYPDNCIVSDSELKSYTKLPIRNRVEKILDNSISLSSIIFTDKLKMIKYYQQRKPYLCFLSSEKEYISIPEEEIINDIDSVPFLPVFYSSMDANKIVSSFQRYELIDAMNSNKKINAGLKKILSVSEGNSNPVIAIYSTVKD